MDHKIALISMLSLLVAPVQAEAIKIAPENIGQLWTNNDNISGKRVGADYQAHHLRAKQDHRSCDSPGVIKIDDFEMWIHRRLAANVVGYGFAISEGGIPVEAGQGGFAQIPVLDNNVLFTHQTDIQVASVSKTITAIALLQLLAKNDLSPNDAISPYLPEAWKQGPGFGDSDSAITFEDMMTHQTGFEQAIAHMTNAAEEPLPNQDTWEGLELLVANGVPKDIAATSCPKKEDDGTYTLNGPEAPKDGHYGVLCYNNVNYALARELIWRLALDVGDLNMEFDEQDPEFMAYASASGYQKYVQDHVLAPAGVVGACEVSGSPATRSLMYDIKGNVPFVMLTAGVDAYSNDESDLLECGPYNWSLSALDLIKVLSSLRCGNLLNEDGKDWMYERKMGWSEFSNDENHPDQYWHGGYWWQNRSSVEQALWPPHPDHPENDPTAPDEDCVYIGPNLVCPASGPVESSIRSCVFQFPFGIDAALVLNSNLAEGPDVSACTVLRDAFDKLL